MLDNIYNNSIFNLKNSSNYKSLNSDILNIKSDFNNSSSNNNNVRIDNKSLTSNQNPIIIKAKKEVEEKRIVKLKKIPKYNKIIDIINNKKSKETLKKSKTYTNFFNSSNNTFNSYKNFSKFQLSLNKNNIDKKLNKTNSFFFNTSKNNEKNKIMYYNSSFNDINKLIIPKSDRVSFISNILNTYKKNEKNRNILKNIKKKNKLNNEKKEENNKNIFKGFSFLSMNKSMLDTLFKKTPIKIKTGVLTSIEDEDMKSRIRLNPFSNSYGYILDELSEKIGFIRGSINMIYPKISQAKYQLKEFEKADYTNKLFNKTRKKIIKVSNSFDRSKNIYGKKLKLFNDTKPRMIIRKFFTKYPISIGRKGENVCSTKMYSLKKQRFFIIKD